jgi:hypothetical protein
MIFPTGFLSVSQPLQNKLTFPPLSTVAQKERALVTGISFINESKQSNSSQLAIQVNSRQI